MPEREAARAAATVKEAPEWTEVVLLGAILAIDEISRGRQEERLLWSLHEDSHVSRDGF